MRERLIHIVEQFEFRDGNDRIVLAHEVSQKAVETKLAFIRVALIGLVLIYNVLCPCLTRVRIQYLVEARVPLRLVQKIDELHDGHQSALAVTVSPDNPLEYLLHVGSLSEGLVKIEEVLKLKL